MPTPVLQPSFAGGELTPSLYARVDLARYQTCLKTCRNFIAQVYGGAKNRAGTRMVQEIKDSTKRVRLIPFVFNQDQAYILELGDHYLRAYTDGAPLLGVTAQPNNGTLSLTQVSYNSGAKTGVYTLVASLDTFVVGDVGRTIEVALTGFYDSFVITARSNTKTVTVSGTRDFTGVTLEASPYWLFRSATANLLFETVTPWAESDLASLVFTQSADVLTVVHPDYAPQDIRRLTNGCFDVRDTEILNGPFKPVNVDKDLTVTISGSEGTVTINASAPIFKSAQIGQLFYVEPLDPGIPWGPGKAVTTGDIRTSDGKWYKAEAPGTTGTIPPTHFEGTITDGAVNWIYQHSGFGIARITEMGTLVDGYSYSCKAEAQGVLPEGLNTGFASPTKLPVTSFSISPDDATRVRVVVPTAHGLATNDSVTYATEL